MKRAALILLLLLTSLTACTRKSGKASLTIKTSKALNGSLAAMPTGQKICYGVNVVGEGITSTSRSCGASYGVFAGYVEAGGTLEVLVPRGTNRSVELYAFITPDNNAACPGMQAACEATVNCNTYKVATVGSVNLDQAEVTLEMTTNYTGINSVAQDAPSSLLCSGSWTAALTSGGEIVDSSLATLSAAAEADFTFYKKSGLSGFQRIQRSGASTEAGLMLKPQVRSVSVKPGTAQMYGVLSNGALVSVDASGSYTEIAAGSCPFSSCSLPPWFKSFSLSNGSDVFGLDHGGGLWKMDASGNPVQVTTVPPFIQQVLFE